MLNKNNLFKVILSLTLVGCYYDGEKVLLQADAINSQECVTANYKEYEAEPYDVVAHGKVAPLHSDGFPQNKLLAGHSNICTAITITNTNHSHNSNNIVVIGNGLEVEYWLDGHEIKQSIYDPKASDINIPEAGQTAKIISIFDPDNCVTTQGGHVKILKDNFHSCTFYLHITDPSYHFIKDNTINLTLSYSNGDQIYQAKTRLNYKSKIFAANALGNIASLSDLGNQFINWISEIKEPIFHISNDNLGHLYFFGKNNVYVYNDKILLYQFASPINNDQVKEDGSGNIFISDGKDIYIVNSSILSEKHNMKKITNNLISGTSVALFAIAKSQLYVLIDKNKIYKSKIGSDYNWELVLDGDKDTILQGKSLHTIYKDVVYDYDFETNQINVSNVNINPGYSNTNIKKWFNFSIPPDFKSVPYFVFDHGDHGVLFSKKYHFFEPNTNVIDAEKIDGVYTLPGENMICLFGEGISIDVDIFRHLYGDQQYNNLLCINEQDNSLKYISGIPAEVISLTGVGSLNQ